MLLLRIVPKKFILILIVFLGGIQALFSQERVPVLSVEDLEAWFGPQTQMGAALRSTRHKQDRPCGRVHLYKNYVAGYLRFARTAGVIPDEEHLKNIFRNMADHENAFCKEYYVFYHGQPPVVTLIQDLTRLLYQAFKQKSFSDNSVLLRPPSRMLKMLEFMGFDNIKRWWCQRFCVDGLLGRYFLSVGPTPFIYTEHAGEFANFLSETPIDHFFRPVENGGSACIGGGVTIAKLLKQTLQAFGLGGLFESAGKSFLAEVASEGTPVNEYLKENGGLLQIFLDKKCVDTCVYLCSPAGQESHDAFYSDMDGAIMRRSINMKNVKSDRPLPIYQDIPVSQILEYCQIDPGKAAFFCPDCGSSSLATGLNRLQFRIFLAPSIFENESSNLIFRFMKKPHNPGVYARYKECLEAFVQGLKKLHDESLWTRTKALWQSATDIVAESYRLWWAFYTQESIALGLLG